MTKEDIVRKIIKKAYRTCEIKTIDFDNDADDYITPMIEYYKGNILYIFYTLEEFLFDKNHSFLKAIFGEKAPPGFKPRWKHYGGELLYSEDRLEYMKQFIQED